MATLLVFASLRELAGSRTHVVPGGTVGEVLQGADERFGPEFERAAASATLVVDGVVVDRAATSHHPASSATEVALLPPVSGG